MNRYWEPLEAPRRYPAGFGRHVRSPREDPKWADAEDAVGDLRRVLDVVGELSDFVGLRVVRNVVGRPVVQLGTVEPEVARELARVIRAATMQPVGMGQNPTPVLLPSLRRSVAETVVGEAVGTEPAGRAGDRLGHQLRATDGMGLRPVGVPGAGERGTGFPRPGWSGHEDARLTPASEDPQDSAQ